MSAGYDQYLFPAQKLVMQNLRQSRKRTSLVAHMLELSIPARNCIPHPYQIPTRRKIFF